MRPIRLVFVSANALTRRGMSQMVLHAVPPIEVTGTFSDFLSARQYLDGNPVDVILIDETLPPKTDLTRKVRAICVEYVGAAVIVILPRPTASLVQRLLAYGVRGILHNALLSFLRESDGIWKLRIALSMCWGCFGDHSFRSGQCWGVLCQCCGGTGWEGDTLEFCMSHEPPIDQERIVETPSPRNAFIELQKRPLSMLEPLRDQKDIHITPALVRDDVAKIEVTTPITRYFALMRNISGDQWQLNAFAPLCVVCGGVGRDPADEAIPCSACAGLKWGQLGDFRYCRHTNSEWWTLKD